MARLTNQLMLLTSSTSSCLRPPGVALMAIVLAGLSATPMTSTLSGQEAPRRVASQTAVAGQVASPVPPSTAGVWTTASAERPVPTRYAGDESALRLLESRQASPLALATADFDEDGVADLVSGYAGGGGGIITLHRGNVDSIFPNTPAAKQRRAAGRFSDSPFVATARAFAAPAAPDFLAAGDFDADGHSDVLAAAQGGEAVLLRGDGRGGLRAAHHIDLPGAVTAMAVGEINGRDGLPDVVFGIARLAGPQALVFAGRTGALRSAPDAFDLPADATALALADLDDDASSDLAVAAGAELLIIYGRARRSPATIASRPEAGTARVDRRSLPFTIGSLAAGNFTGDRRTDLALASQDGQIHLLTDPAGAAGTEAARAGGAGWDTDVVAQGVGAGPTRMVGARLANRPTDDLLVVDASDRQLHVLTNQSQAVAAATASDTGRPWTRSSSKAAAALPMRLNMDTREDLVMLRAGQRAPLVAVTQAAVTFVVTNTNDSGAGSLRQAILDANASPGGDEVLITFAIPGPGPHTITPLTPLPTVFPDDPSVFFGGRIVIIDGTSQPGFAGRPVVELSGAVVGTSGNGLSIRTNGSGVRGLVINRFAAGIRFIDDFAGDFPIISGIVEGSFIGTDVSGTADLGNSVGVLVDSARGITIGGTSSAARNVISGNGVGIRFTGTVTAQGNFIGTDATGRVALGNSVNGLAAFGSAQGEIGGTAAGARNIISGNGGDGIFMQRNNNNLLVSNNYIGIDVSGARPLGNAGDGIALASNFTGAIISGNVISANGGHGVLSSSVNSVAVLDNRIGTDSAGMEALGNRGSGIDGFNSGGLLVAGNLVAANREHGIVMTGSGNMIQGNRIGTDITGTAALGNLGDGVHLLDIGITIGGADSDAANVIAFNGGAGVRNSSGLIHTPILSNAIFSNGGLGIDLGDDGVTPNDACDMDEQQNFPVIGAVTSSAAGTTIQGQLNSRPSTTYQLQFFASDAADPSGFGEGARFLGSAMVTTDTACNATFTVTLPEAVAAGQFVTATAQNPSTTGTSEFSNALAFVRQLRILTPNAPSRWGLNTRQRLAWTYLGDSAQFLIEISRDSGRTWTDLATVANEPGNSQNFDWTVTGPLTSAAKFRVSAIGEPGATDVNDVDVRIAAATIEILFPTRTTSVAVGSSLTLHYRHSLGARAPVVIEVSSDNGNQWRTVAETMTTGSLTSSFRWIVDLLPTSHARVRVRAMDGSGAKATSSAFVITAAAGT